MSFHPQILRKTLIISAVALCLAAYHRQLTAKGSNGLPMAICLCGALLTKPLAVLWALGLAVAWGLLHRKVSSDGTAEQKSVSWQGAMGLLAVAVLPVLPFYAQQIALSVDQEMVDKSPFNRTFLVGSTLETLKSVSENAAREAQEQGQVHPLAGFFADYVPDGDIPGRSMWALGVLVLIAGSALMGSLQWPMVLLFMICTLHYVVWAISASYSTRNLLPVLSCVPILACAGISHMGATLRSSLRRPRMLRAACMLICVAFLLLVGFPFVQRAGRRSYGILRNARLRVACMLHPVENRQKLWYAKEYELVNSLTNTDAYAKCRYVFTYDELCRFLPKSIYSSQKLWVEPEPGRDLIVLPRQSKMHVPVGWEPFLRTDAYVVCAGSS